MPGEPPIDEHPVRALGRRLDLARRRRGWTYRDLEQRAGISRSTLQYMISYRQSAPDYLVLRALVGKLGETWSEEWEQLWRRAVEVDPAAGPPGSSTAGRPLPPAQLPAAIRHFTGRATDLAVLNRLLNDYLAGERAAVISTIDGMAGIGKTALALHWANQVADEFPGGHLYANLRGYDPAGTPVQPAGVIRGFLTALGVPVRQIPTDTQTQTALYRRVLHGRRVLVVLDNARDVEQVRPLLPGVGSFVVITSRCLLTRLVAVEGAHPITLDPLTRTESLDLLDARLGSGRVAAEPTAATEVVTSCSGLPLALTIVAARAATRPRYPLGALADQLRETRDRLDALADHDPYLDIRTALSWSYQRLSVHAARLLRLLSLHPGPDITTSAAASLLGVALTVARSLLAELNSTNLVGERHPDRFALHDLVRVYATELADTQEPASEQRDTQHRILDHYLYTAHAADRLLDPHRDPIRLPAAAVGVTPEHHLDHRHAMTWFTAEHPVLLAALRQATHQFDEHVCKLAWSLSTFVHRQAHWYDWAATQRAALGAARRLADRCTEAYAHRSLGGAYTRLNRLPDATGHLRRALTLYTALDHRTGQAHTHLNLAWVREQQGQVDRALRHATHALDLYRTAGHPIGQGRALNATGWFHARLGEHRQALTHCRQALALFEHIGENQGMAATWDSLGYAHHHLGHHRQAIVCYQRALDLDRRLGDRFGEADTLGRLGDSHHATGNLLDARTSWQQATNLLHHIEQPRRPPASS